MRLLTRWAYLVPRLIILGLVGLILWIGSDPIIKYALEQTGEKYTGVSRNWFDQDFPLPREGIPERHQDR